MGRIRHSTIVITGSERADADAAHNHAIKLGLLASPVMHGTTNGYCSFMIIPDGSKESWEESTRHDKARFAWTQWAREARRNHTAYFDWVYLDFGGDDDDVHVRDWNDNPKEEIQTYFT